MELTEFKNLINEFIEENLCISGCKECHETGNGEIVPEDIKSYEKDIEQIFNEVRK